MSEANSIQGISAPMWVLLIDKDASFSKRCPAIRQKIVPTYYVCAMLAIWVMSPWLNEGGHTWQKQSRTQRLIVLGPHVPLQMNRGIWGGSLVISWPQFNLLSLQESFWQQKLMQGFRERELMGAEMVGENMASHVATSGEETAMCSQTDTAGWCSSPRQLLKAAEITLLLLGNFPKLSER